MLVWVFFSVFFWVFVLGCVISFSCCAFRVPFWPWVLGAVLLFLPSCFFVAVLACVFYSFAFFFFKKAILLFLIFCFFFWRRVFFSFFPLTFHNGQIAKKAFLSF